METFKTQQPPFTNEYISSWKGFVYRANPAPDARTWLDNGGMLEIFLKDHGLHEESLIKYPESVE